MVIHKGVEKDIFEDTSFKQQWANPKSGGVLECGEVFCLSIKQLSYTPKVLRLWGVRGYV
jgi:hypothetical protein